MGWKLRGGALAAGVLSAITLSLLAASPALAAVSAVPSSSPSSDVLAIPYVPPRSPTVAPIVWRNGHATRFHADALAALRAAEHAPAMIALHRRLHPLAITILIWTGVEPHWALRFAYRGAVQAEVEVSPEGRVTKIWNGPLALYLAGRGHYGGLFDSPFVVLVFAALFLVPFFAPRGRRVRQLDGLLLLGLFAIPYVLFDHAQLEASVLLVYPLLVAVLARMLWLGLRRRSGASGDAPLLPLPLLALGVVALLAARVVLDIVDHDVIDVGVASVIGAHAVNHGLQIYSAAAASHGDTYGPIVYLAYAPFEALWPWTGVWNYLPAAHAAAIFFDLATTIGLVVLGIRLRPGGAGRRLGLTLAWSWAAYPATLLGLLTNTNDGIVAFLFVLLLLALTTPVGRGVALGLAAGAKLFPVVLLPLFGLAWRDRRRRNALIVAAAFALVVVATFAPFVPPGGLSVLYGRTLGFQLDRFDVSSIWGLYPGLGWLKTLVELAAGALVVVLPWPARNRSVAGLAALACALTVAVQLPAEHWFFNYLPWIVPFALVALFAPQAPPPSADASPSVTRVVSGRRRRHDVREPARSPASA